MYAEGPFTALDYKKSVNKEIEKIIEKERKNKNDALFNKGKYDKNIDNENQIMQSIENLNHTTVGDRYKPSSSVKDAMQALIDVVSNKEYIDLINNINMDIRRHNYTDKVVQINKLSSKIEELTKKAGISSHTVTVMDDAKLKSQNMTINLAVNKLAEAKRESIDKDYGTLNLEPQNLPDNYDAIRLINLANSDSLEATMENMRFKNNAQKIAQQLEIRDSALKIIERCERLRRELEIDAKENEMDFSKINQTLNTLVQEKKKALAQANSFLKSQNIDKYLEEAKKFEQEDRDKEVRNHIFSEYENIVKEIEDLKKNDPNNLARIHELKEQLEKIKIANVDKDINFGEYDKKEEKAKEEYQQEQQIEKMLQEEKEEERAMMREINRNYKEYLRRRAINELKASGDYDNVNREELIREKIAEISRSEKASDDEFTRRQIQEAENKLMAIAQEQLDNENIFTDEVEVIEAKVAEMIAGAYMTPEERCREDMIKQGMDEREITDSLVASNAGYYKDGTSGYEHTKEIQQLVQEIGNYNASLSPVYEQDNDYSK